MEARDAEEGRTYRCFGGIGRADILVIPIPSENRWMKIGEYNHQEWLVPPKYIDIS